MFFLFLVNNFLANSIINLEVPIRFAMVVLNFFLNSVFDQ